MKSLDFNYRNPSSSNSKILGKMRSSLRICERVKRCVKGCVKERYVKGCVYKMLLESIYGNHEIEILDK